MQSPCPPARGGHRSTTSRSLARHVSDPQTPPTRLFPAMPGSLTGSTDADTPLSDSRTHGAMSAGVVESKPESILFGAGKARPEPETQRSWVDSSLFLV